MARISTFYYEVNNLASKVSFDLIDTNDFDSKEEFSDVFEMLSELEGIDVRQEVVDRILDFAKNV